MGPNCIKTKKKIGKNNTEDKTKSTGSSSNITNSKGNNLNPNKKKVATIVQQLATKKKMELTNKKLGRPNSASLVSKDGGVLKASVNSSASVKVTAVTDPARRISTRSKKPGEKSF